MTLYDGSVPLPTTDRAIILIDAGETFVPTMLLYVASEGQWYGELGEPGDYHDAEAVSRFIVEWDATWTEYVPKPF